MEMRQESDANWRDGALVPGSNDTRDRGIDATSSPAPVVTSHTLVESKPGEVGSIIGNRYLLQAQIGVGHLGTVFEALDQQLTQASERDHRVNIELLTLKTHQGNQQTQLANSYLSLVPLSHPNLSRIMDFGIDGTTVFVVTEFLEGTTLDSILESSSKDAFTEGEILAIVRGVSDALEYVHEKGFVHGNLRASSIFITEEFDVKVVDLASVVMTRTFGNIDAQRIGDSQTLKPTTDVFGIAAITYELLANEPPYDGLPRGHARKKELKVRKIAQVPRRQWRTLAQALHLQPTKRTSSVAEFAGKFGVVGNESLSDALPDNASGGLQTLKPLLILLVAAIGTAGFLQVNLPDTLDAISVTPNTETIQSVSMDQNSLVAIAETPDPPFESGPEPQSELVDTPAATAPADITASLSADSESAPLDPPDTTALAENVANIEDMVLAAENTLPATDNIASALDEVDSEVLLPDVAAQALAESIPTAAIQATAEPAPMSAQPAIMVFSRESIVASEGQGMIQAVLQRSGDLQSSLSVIWWTEDNTATANRDYADLGVRTEKIASGEENITVYIPLIADSVAESRESFFVYVSTDTRSGVRPDRLEVIINDDDR